MGFPRMPGITFLEKIRDLATVTSVSSSSSSSIEVSRRDFLFLVLSFDFLC
jgi:hypothetical protein